MNLPFLPTALGAIFLLAVPSTAQDDAATRILTRCDELRPPDRDLAMYNLDWEPSLDDALARAKEENRPVFLVLIHAKYGDIFSGHC